MGSFISAKVIKHNNHTFIDEDGVVGSIMPIPTPQGGGVLDGDYWAVPITDHGVFTSFNYYIASPTDDTPPSLDSFHVFRMYRAKADGRDSWYVVGRTTYPGLGSPAENGYVQASSDAECCAVSPRQLPTTVPFIAGCQLMCTWDANSKYFAIYGAPTLIGNQRYYPNGYVNGVKITGQTATGYATTGTLLTFLNSGITGALGTWTYANGQFKVTQSNGAGIDVICLSIATVNPSA